MGKIDAKFRKLVRYSSIEIESLETNIADALSRITADALSELVPTNTKTSSYTADVGELVVTNATMPVRLPVASEDNQGNIIGVLVRSGTVTVSCVSGLVQGTASDALATIGLYLYVSTGVGWWRSPDGIISVVGGSSSLVTVSTSATGVATVSGNEDRVKAIASYHP